MERAAEAKFCGGCGSALDISPLRQTNNNDAIKSERKASNSFKDYIKGATIGGILFAIMIEAATWDKLGFDVHLLIIGFVGGFLIGLMATHMNNTLMNSLKGDKEK